MLKRAYCNKAYLSHNKQSKGSEVSNLLDSALELK